MEEQDSLRTVLYGWARFGLYLLIIIFADIIGKTAILGIVGTFVPKLALYDNPGTLSFISWLIPAWLLIWLFSDDAKRHVAYGRYNLTAVMIIILLTSIAYYAPVFILEYMEDKKVVSAIEGFYFTSYWFSRIDDDPQIYALIGAIVNMVLCILSYFISGKIYFKKFAEEEEEE